MIANPSISADDLMLATLYPAPFSRENWIFELKYDGFRCLVRKLGSRVELLSRNGKPLNRSFPDIAAAIERLPGSFVWDAELTVDEVTGRSSFERLQLRARTSMAMRVREAARLHPARLYVFDLLAAGARDLRELPLIQRKEMLRDTFDDAAALIYVTGVVAAGAWVFEQAVRHDFEGMIGKRLDSPYQRGRSNYWHKVKNQGYSRPAALGWGRNVG